MRNRPGAAAQTTIDALFASMYGQLQQAAARLHHRLGQSGGDDTVALVHEAYLRLLRGATHAWESHAHFLNVAMVVMRRILMNGARDVARLKRGGRSRRESLQDQVEIVTVRCLDVLILRETLERLAHRSPRQARIVELRIFAGMHMSEVARTMGVSTRTAEGEWAYARDWLRDELLTSGRGATRHPRRHPAGARRRPRTAPP